MSEEQPKSAEFIAWCVVDGNGEFVLQFPQFFLDAKTAEKTHLGTAVVVHVTVELAPMFLAAAHRLGAVTGRTAQQFLSDCDAAMDE